MPTGYTAAIKDGITFDQFILRCARAFGPLISMRDDPLDTPIPETLTASTYHLDRLKEDTATRFDLLAMSDAEVQALLDADYAKEVAEYERMIADKDELRQRYTSMIEQVKAWQPPTDDHAPLKQFMESQLAESIKHDCNVHGEPPVKKTVGEYRDERVSRLDWSIDYHNKEQAQEDARTASRNAWLQQLRASIAQPKRIGDAPLAQATEKSNLQMPNLGEFWTVRIGDEAPRKAKLMDYSHEDVTLAVMSSKTVTKQTHPINTVTFITKSVEQHW